MRRFFATLVTPPSEQMKELGLRKRMQLCWITDPDEEGAGILKDREGEQLYGLKFRELHERLGSWVNTNDPQKVCRALGLPIGEPGIVRGRTQ